MCLMRKLPGRVICLIRGCVFRFATKANLTWACGGCCAQQATAEVCISLVTSEPQGLSHVMQEHVYLGHLTDAEPDVLAALLRLEKAIKRNNPRLLEAAAEG